MPYLVRMTLETGEVAYERFPVQLLAEWFMCYTLAAGYQVNGQRVVSARLVRLVN